MPRPVTTPDNNRSSVPTRAITIAFRRRQYLYAKRQHVRAWFAKGDDDFVLLGTFREEQTQPARSS